MQSKVFYQTIGLVAITALSVQPAFAGPGGTIAKAAVNSFWGRVVLVLLVIFFLPLILWNMTREWLAIKRARSDLAYVAQHDQQFNWLKLKNRAKECVQRVHLGWQDGDLSDINAWMTSWYWQNQQSVFLNQWKAQGLVNVCKVKKINSVRPMYFSHTNENGVAHEGSDLVVLVTVKMQDYLEHKATGEIVEGCKKWKDVESVWTLTLTEGQWLVSDIEEGYESVSYANMRKFLPNIESTMKSSMNA